MSTAHSSGISEGKDLVIRSFPFTKIPIKKDAARSMAAPAKPTEFTELWGGTQKILPPPTANVLTALRQESSTGLRGQNNHQISQRSSATSRPAASTHRQST